MSTRAVIARHISGAGWEGRYHHSDGYPTGLGRVLFALYRQHFHSDAEAMLHFLIDEHPAGWSFLGLPTEAGGMTDYNMPTGYITDHEKLYAKGKDGRADLSKPLPHGPECFCHGDRNMAEDLIRSTEAPGGLEWAYIIHPGARNMRVLKAFYALDREATYWQEVAVVDLDGQEPEWEFIECGHDLEYCTHYAWKHFPDLNETVMNRLGTAKFLGTKPLKVDDAYAFEIGGVTYGASSTGCQVTSIRDGSKMWAALLRPPQGHSPLIPNGAKAMYMPFAGQQQYEDGSFYYPVYGYKKDGSYKQLPGVKPIYPPTLKQPLQVFAAIRAVRPATTAKDALESFITTRKFRDEE